MVRRVCFVPLLGALLLTQSCFVLETALCDDDDCRLGEERCDGDDAIEVCVETTCGDSNALIHSWETVENCDDVCEERQSGVFCK